MGQQAQGHVLEGAGGAVEQLQHSVLPHGGERRQRRGAELAGIGGLDQRHGLFPAEIRQEGRDNIGGHASIILLQSALPIELQGGQVRQHIKAAVRGQALENGMGGIGLNHMGAGALVVHGFSPFCRGCSGVTRI